ncbi:hypothetical protein JKP88DRAFT_232166, partial [Tribonema minus]
MNCKRCAEQDREQDMLRRAHAEMQAQLPEQVAHIAELEYEARLSKAAALSSPSDDLQSLYASIDARATRFRRYVAQAAQLYREQLLQVRRMGDPEAQVPALPAGGTAWSRGEPRGAVSSASVARTDSEVRPSATCPKRAPGWTPEGGASTVHKRFKPPRL